MQNIPSIRQSSGVFEIFVPGVFLLVNYLAAIFIAVYPELQKIPPPAPAETIAFGLILFTCLGYLFGMALRLLKTSRPDRLSGWLNLLRCKILRKQPPLWVIEPYPYIGWSSIKIQKDLPPQVHQFYLEFWKDRKTVSENTRFINYCKNLLNVKDNPITVEIAAAEATLRFLSGMFYSLIISIIVLIGVITTTNSGASCRQYIIFIVILPYLICLYIITSNFRLFRLKEVDIIFDATYQNKDLFLNKDK